MRVLAIETSCDETAIALLECTGDTTSSSFRVLGNALQSQVDLHRPYGGVYPALAKREHAKNLVPVLATALEGAERAAPAPLASGMEARLRAILEREPELADALVAYLSAEGRPAIDAIAITDGPGLEPALWTGVNLARSLAIAWAVPLVPVNHMEGHLLSALAVPTADDGTAFSIEGVELPLLGLLVSGGHTEFVLMRDWLSYELVGRTRDDAVGEAYDKVARMLGLPYPGGPEVSRLAEAARARGSVPAISLPRPMLNDDSCDFSFSGLKTAVLYAVKDRALADAEREELCLAFEDTVADVLVTKTLRAVDRTGARTVALGGGVSANLNLRRRFAAALDERMDTALRLPEPRFTTDNAVMIGIAGAYRARTGAFADPETLRADGNRALA